jgi:DNA-binding NarL/FixJ family response regulator
MNYLFAPESVTQRQRIFGEVGEAISDGSGLEMFEDVDGILAGLKEFSSPEIVIVLAVGKDEMPAIVSLCNLIPDADIIIMLTDEEPQTIASALRVRPRYVGVMDDDLDKLVPIIKKLIRKKAAGLGAAV